MVLTPDYLTTNQSEERAPADVALLVEHFKIGHYPLQDRTHSLDHSSPLCPSLPGKAVKLFLSTSPKTLVSVLLFSTSEQRLSFSNSQSLSKYFILQV